MNSEDTLLILKKFKSMNKNIEYNELLVEKAKVIATVAHAGYYRKDRVTDYIVHPAAVAERVKNQSSEIIATAWLHDTIEDTSVTVESLIADGIPQTVIDAVLILTLSKGMHYSEYLERVKKHPIAKVVKIADMLSNLADSPSKNQIIKYCQGLLYLMDDSIENVEKLLQKPNTVVS